MFADIDAATAAAKKAFEAYTSTPLATRERMVAAMRKVTLDNVQALSEYAVAETGLGRVEDKIKKNTLVATKTPGPEILRPTAFTGDHGLTVLDRRRLPAGLLGGGTAALAVSVEPPGGSPTGVPTGPVVFAGKLQL